MRLLIATLISIGLAGLTNAVGASDPAVPNAGPPTFPPDRPTPKPAVPDALKKQTTADQIATAHRQKAWNQQAAFECTLDVTFTDAEPFHADVVYDHKLHGVQLKTKDATVVYDGAKCWVTPSDVELPLARFHAQTWPFILAAPFELDRDGVDAKDAGVLRLQDKPYRAVKVTFGKGVRDSADDWFLVYADPVTYQIRAIAYSIGLGDEKDATDHAVAAITFENFGIFDGVVIATDWTFWEYTEDGIITGEPIGHGKVSRIRFSELPDDAFDRPANAREVKRPEPKKGETEDEPDE